MLTLKGSSPLWNEKGLRRRVGPSFESPQNEAAHPFALFAKGWVISGLKSASSAQASYQGTSLDVPVMTAGDLGFSPCGVKQTGFAEARVLVHRINAARLKTCPDTTEPQLAKAAHPAAALSARLKSCPSRLASVTSVLLGPAVPTPSASSELALSEAEGAGFSQNQGKMGHPRLKRSLK
jgi:hypothetical protein